MDEGYRRKAAGDPGAAALAFQRARAAGFDRQRVDLELGYLALQRDDQVGARALFRSAALGGEPGLASQARAELRQGWLREAALRRSRRDFEGARIAIHAARHAGLDPQRAELELAYLAIARQEQDDAREHLSRAEAGPDPAVSSRAREELGVLPGRAWGELYSEVYAWNRTSGASRTADAVPTVRIRAGRRLRLDLDLSAYLYAQGTRDLASRGAATGAPLLKADNFALLGAGVLVRLWERRLALFLQAGPALNLLDDGRGRTALDARGGAALGLETSRCWPGAAEVASRGLVPCGELYAEVVYQSRFGHDVVGLARGRASATWLVTGPWLWQLAAELRAATDRNRDFYDNFVDAGIGPRLRLRRPFRLDVFPTFSAGSYLGVAGRDPAPRPLGYAELRLQVATSLEF
jgi:hypothetical protein